MKGLADRTNGLSRIAGLRRPLNISHGRDAVSNVRHGR